jgi:hypothetical protein
VGDEDGPYEDACKRAEKVFQETGVVVAVVASSHIKALKKEIRKRSKK